MTTRISSTDESMKQVLTAFITIGVGRARINGQEVEYGGDWSAPIIFNGP